MWWTRIREIVSFSGKSVVEIGASMGLLCSFALLEGARASRGIDGDAAIVDAAREIARVLGVAPAFEVRCADAAEPWEDRLTGADLAVALSVREWAGDHERLLRFLGRHREVLYEGHDAVEIEEQRLRHMGFTDISLVLMTERHRPLLYACKREA